MQEDQLTSSVKQVQLRVRLERSQDEEVGEKSAKKRTRGVVVGNVVARLSVLLVVD